MECLSYYRNIHNQKRPEAEVKNVHYYSEMVYVMEAPMMTVLKF